MTAFYIQGESLTLPAGTTSVARTTTANPENPTPGLDSFGLRPGYTGNGYLDINGGAGGKASFTFDAPAGTYDIVVRLANGSTAGGTAGSRPITLTVDGVTTLQQTTNTGGWSTWQERKFTVTVTTDGTHTVTLNQIDSSNAPNIDAIAVVETGGVVNFAAPTVAATKTVITNEDTASAAVAIGATDLDGDTLTYSVKTGAEPAKGTVAFSGGSFTYTPNANENGSDTFTILVSDGQGGTAEQVVNVTINSVNDAAVITGDATGSVTEDGTLEATGTLSVSDVDAGEATFAAQTNAAGTYGSFSITEAGAWTYTLDNAKPAVQALTTGATLTDTFTVASADGTTQSVTVTINGADEPAGANTPATFGGDTSGSIAEDATPNTVSGTLTVADIDAGEASIIGQIETVGSYGSFSITAAGAWTYTLDNGKPAVQALGVGATLTDTFSVASLDGTTQAVSVTITGTNDAAVITGTATGSVTEDTTPNTVTGTLSVTDTDTGEASFVAQTDTPAAYGLFSITTAGAWTYTLNNAKPAVQALAAGATLTDTVTVASADGTTQDVTVTINGKDEPVFVPTYIQGEALTFPAPSTPPLSTETVARTETGNKELSAVEGGPGDNTGPGKEYNDFGIRPGYTGTGYLDINGGSGAKASFSFEAPKGTYDIVIRLAASTDRPLTLTVDGVTTANISTNTGNFNVWQEKRVTVTVTTDGMHTVTLNQVGGSAPNIDAIAVVAQGAEANFAAPTAPATNSVTTDEDTASAAIAIGAADVEGDTLTYAVKAGAEPAKGSVAFSGGSFTYTPAANANGTDSFTIVVSDGQGGTAEQVVSVTVNAVNDAAVITGDTTGSVTEDADPNTATGTLSVSDVDAGEATFVAETNAAGTYGSFSITEAGVWTYTLNNALPAVQALTAAGAPVTDTFTVASADGTTQAVTVTINGADEPVNTPATITGDSTGSVTEDAATTTVTGTLTVTDPDAGEASIIAQSAPGNYGSFDIDAAGAWTYTLDNDNAAVQALDDGQSLTEIFTVSSADGVEQDITVTINGADEPGFDTVYIQGENLEIVADAAGRQASRYVVKPENMIPGSTGTGYLDLNGSAGEKAKFTFTAPAGTYDVVVRLTMGLNDSYNRPIALKVDGQQLTPYQSSNTGAADKWDERTFSITVGTDGEHTVAIWRNGLNGPFIDAIAIAKPGTPVNFAAPTVAATNTVTTDEDTASAAVAIGATDLDGDTLSYAVKAGAEPTKGTVAFSGGSFTYTPNANANGTDSFTILVSDGQGGTAEQAVNVTINAVNDAAVITGDTTGSVTEDATPNTATGTLTVSDIDSVATVVAQTDTAGTYGKFSITEAGAWTYTLDNGKPAVQALTTGATLTDTFTVASADGTTQSVTVTINGADEPVFTPVIIQGEALTFPTPSVPPLSTETVARTTAGNRESSAIEGGANDNTGPGKEYDDFGLRQNYTGTGYLDINGAAGEKASFTFAGPAGDYVVTLRVANGAGGSGASFDRALALKVGGITTPFQATNTGGWSNWQERSYTISVTGDGPHTVAILTNVTNGPNIDAVAVTLPGAPVNFAAPTVSATNTVTTDEDTASAATAIGATDLDGDTLAYAVKTGAEPAKGTVAFSGGSFTYTPNANVNGSDTFTIVVSDGQGGTAEQVVSVTINAVNDAATISGDTTGSVTEDGTLEATGTLTVSDIDSDATFVAEAGVASTYGSFSITEAGVWTYTLDNAKPAVQALASGATLTDTFTVASADGTTQSVTVTINGADEPAAPGPFTLVIQAEDLTKVTVTDADNDTVVRTQGGIKENSATAANSGPGLTYDAFGLRPGYTGTGYLDPGNDIGDKIAFSVDAPTAGTYKLIIRYVNGDSGGNSRPMTLDVNGTTSTVSFASTGTGDPGWSKWTDVAVDVTLQKGANAISLANSIANGPNIDRITVTNDVSADEDGNLNLLGPDTDIRAGSGAAQSMNFRLEGIDPDIQKVEISFDGGVTKSTVLPDADGDIAVVTSALGVGTYTVTTYVTDAVGNVASDSMQVRIVDSAAAPFEVVIQAEDLTRVTSTDTDNDTVVRTQGGTRENSAIEGGANDNTGPGKIYDDFGLRPGYSGTGYLDPGNDIGDKFAFSVDAPEAGTYKLTIRYVNADGGGNQRPLELDVNGTKTNVAFPVTGTGDAGWSNWTDVTVDVTLKAGANAISLANTIANGPNIDRITVKNDVQPDNNGRVEQRFQDIVKINFQPAPGQSFQGLPAGFQTPAGFLADTGAAYGDRGNGFSYGWVSEESVADGTANGTTPMAQPTNAMWYKNTVSNATDLQKTYAHFEYPGAGASGSRAWEMALQNGTYQVTMSIGDTAGAFDSTYIVNVEGQRVTPAWIPANPIDGTTNGGGFRSTLVTRTVQVTDGKLTIDSIGGSNTEIQYLEIARIPDLTPNDNRSADQDYSKFLTPQADSLTQGRVDLAIGANGELPVGIDPTGFFVVGLEFQNGAELRRGPNIATIDNVKLVETLTGIEVPIAVQITGGADSLTIRPRADLKENTSYTLKVQDVMDLGVVENFDAPIRQFQEVTTTFVTGTKPQIEAKPVAFNDLVQLDGFAEGAYGYTSVEFGPDGKLYIATIMGDIHRFAINADGTIDKASQETLTHDYFQINAQERRGIIGIEFDPTDPNVIWVSDNYAIPRQDKAHGTPEFSGQISKITLGTGGSFAGATAQTYIKGLPRSGGDHLTNSIEFRANPEFGVVSGAPEYLLYVTQGSNSAAGQQDGAWGNRPERLLNAAVLEIDPTRTAPQGGFDVSTEPIVGTPTYRAPLSGFNADGTYPGYYNPFAADAVLKIFATGIRNAYDLVWHSNGHLYMPTNGTAGGGITPDDPRTTVNEGMGGHPTQNDYLFNVHENKYYGHPNPLRSEYILNGGNPTSGKDLNEATGTGSITYPVGIQPDPNYDTNNAYSLGLNRSPNGVTEYKSNVFGANLKGAVIFAQFSVGDNVRYVLLDADGKIRLDDVLRRPNGDVIDEYIDPLDIVQHPTTGQLYLMTLDRATGASQLILLNPAVQGGDTTADADNNLAVSVVNLADPHEAVFKVTGLDVDIVQVRASFNNAPFKIVTLNAQGEFTFDLGPTEGQFNLRVQAVDGSGNVATKSLPVTVDYPDIAYIPLLSVQAEDKTPNDGTSVTLPTTGGQIVIRDASNPEASTNAAHVNGLWPGAYGVDGNTDNLDGTPGGYADFGSTNNDFITFSFEVPAGNAGAGLIKVRYTNPSDPATAANGGNRPLSVTVNGTVVTTAPFAPTPGTTSEQRLTNWTEVEIPVTNLVAGTNTVKLQATANTGPNVDQIEVLVRDTFVPVYKAVAGEARIELEATDQTARSVNPSVAEFYFTVAESGAYALDTIANAGAPNGGGLTYRLNGVQIADIGFPTSTGETTIYRDLVAGTQYKLEIRSDLPGANALDYLDVRKAPSNANADIAVQSLDPAYYDNRLHFSWIDIPTSVTASATAPRDYKATGTVRISNTGTSPLEILEATLDGPFALADAAAVVGKTIAAGQFLDVTVNFVRALLTPTGNLVNGVYSGALNIRTNDAEDPIVKVDLAGFWQQRDEGGWEPNVNEVWEVFGFGNRVDGVPFQDSVPGNPLNNGDKYLAVNATEILSPYWQIADGFTSARITQIAAFHGPGGASVGIHGPGNQSGSNQIVFWNHQGDANQTVLPLVGNSNAFPTRVFDRGTIPDVWAGNDLFGIETADYSTDPTLNPNGTDTPQRGHFMRMFQALDKDGNAIPNVFLGIQDYAGINYDYNDNMIVIEGVTPVGNGQLMAISGLDPAAADQRLVFTNIDVKNTGSAITGLGGQQVRDTATVTITNDGIKTLTISSIVSDNPAFEVINAPTSVAAGASATVTVKFVGTHTGTSAGAELITGKLTITSDAFTGGTKTVTLAGLAQEFSENGSEPTVAQIVQAFGYSTDMAQSQLADGGKVETVGDEVLAPYFERLDATKQVEVIQLAAFLQVTNVARLGFHTLDKSTVTNLFAQDDQQSQTVSPDGLVTGNGDTGGVARALFTPTGAFGLKVSVDGRPTFASWSDPVANDLDPAFGNLINGAQADGHLMRYFQAKDANGAVIPGTYIAIQDYPGGGNFDYNDHMFLIRNVKPHALTTAEDKNTDGINDALQTDADNDGKIAFFDDNDLPTQKGDFVIGVNYGGGAIANDPVLGVALVAQSDSRVTISGTTTAAAGTDSTSNANGANAVAGSAFKTYEDGPNWTTTIAVPNGKYVVGIHTQETYWNQAGKRQFDISVNGKQVITDLDPFKAAGPDKPITVETVVNVVNGLVTLNLTADIDNAALNAVTIHKYTGPNAAPAITSAATVSVAENQTTAIDVNATDADDTVLTYSLSGGADSGLFNIDRATGVVTFKSAPDFEVPTDAGKNNVYNITVAASDGLATTTKDVAITVTDVAEAVPQTAFNQTQTPWAVGGTPFTLAANLFDNGGQGVAYNDTTPGKQPNSNINRPGTDVDVNNSNGSIGWIANGEWLEYTINVAEAGKYDLSLLLSNGGSVVRTAVVDFYKPGATTAYATSGTIQNPSGSGFSTFVARTAPGVSLDAGVQVVRMTFPNSDGYQDFQSFSLTRTNVAPVITSAATASVAENQTAAIDVNATDANNDAITYSISGTDAALFNINAQTGVVTFKTAPDFEAPADTGKDNVYNVTVAASDGKAPATTQNVAITVTNVVEAAPQTAFNQTQTPWAVGATPFTLAANLFDNGGQGVAYNDTTPGKQPNSNTNRPGTDVDVNNSNGSIGWIANGEWLEYTINVAEAGKYDLSLLLSNGGSVVRTAVVDFYKPGATTAYATSGTVQNPSGSGFSTFVARTAPGVSLDAGVQVVRMTFPNSDGYQDFQSFSLTRTNVAPVITSAATASVAENQTAAIDVNATDANNDAITYSISGTDAALFNINAQTGVVTFKSAPDFEAPADTGTNNVYNVTVAASDGKATTTQSVAITVTDVAESAPTGQTAFNAAKTPWLVDDVTGLTLAGNLYDNGGQGVAYNDTTAGKQPNSGTNRPGTDVDVNNSNGAIGWIASGEWLEYTVNVEKSGVYDLSLLMSNGGSAARTVVVEAFKPGATTAYESSGTITNASTGGYSTFLPRSGTLALEEGEQVIRVSFPNSANQQDFQSLKLTPTQTAFESRVLTSSSPLTIDAQDFDNGGQGVAYNDTTPGKQPNSDDFRKGTDVDINDRNGAIGWTENGEWVEYTLDVDKAGVYDFSLLMSNGSGSTKDVSVDFFRAGESTAYRVFDIDNGATSGWDATAKRDGGEVSLEAGLHVVRVTFDQGGQDLQNLTFVFDRDLLV